jgi:hypothetical protein
MLMVDTEVKNAWSFTSCNAYSQMYSGEKITASALLTFIRQVLDPNVDHEIGYSESTLRGFL